MGMGNYACYADTIEEDFIEEMCPTELENFKVALDEADISFDDLGHCFCYESGDTESIKVETHCEEAEAQKVSDAFEALFQAFQKATGGLELGVGYHDPEDVDRGNEVYGAFWTVEGVYDYTPAGKKHKDKITRKFWTEFG